MTMKELAERVEAATGPNRELDLRCEMVVNPEYAELSDANDHFRWLTRYGGHPRYTASLDAAMTLVPEAVSVLINIAEDGITTAIVDGTQGCAVTPALALCAAALRARASQETTR